MDWTDKADQAQKCESSSGGVQDNEVVARIVIFQNPDTGYQAIKRSDLLKPVAGPVSNDCGAADGLSVDRCLNLSRENVVSRSATRAAAANARRAKSGKAPNQFTKGALIASVGQLRKIGKKSERQVVFVYDDPVIADQDSEGNLEHSVIRLAEVLEEEVAGLIDDVVSCFDRDESSLG